LGAVEKYACMALVTEMTVVVLCGVLTRYVTKGQLPWSAELASYSLAWTTFLGSALVMDRKGHLAIEALVQWLPPSLRKIAQIVSYLVVLASLAIFVLAGFELVLRTKDQLSAAMRIPMAWAYLSIPLGSLFMFVHSFEQFLTLLVGRGE